MNYHLPLILTAMLAAGGSDPGTAPPEPARPTVAAPTEVPGDLISQAAAQLLREPTFQAKLRQRFALFGQALAGSGTYLHKRSPRGLLLRMEWKLPVGGQLTSVQQICDGRFLWVRRDLPPSVVLSRVDLQRVQWALQTAPQPRPADSGFQAMSFGGLPRLLEDLSANFDFPPARSATVEGVPVWIVEGTWKPDRLTQMLSGGKDDAAAPSVHVASRLPSHLPHRVQAVIGKQDLIPRRIDYLRDPAATDAGPPAIAQPVHMATIEILEPIRGEPIDDHLFTYEPGQQEVIDHTDMFVESMLSPKR